MNPFYQHQMMAALSDLYDFLENMSGESGNQWLVFSDIALARKASGNDKKLAMLNGALFAMAKVGMLERRVREGFDHRTSDVKYEPSDGSIPQLPFYNWFEYKVLPIGQ